MEYNYPKFTKEMKQTHTILIPNMAILQFRILKAALEKEGYKVEILNNCGSEVAQLGLKYVHNDTCYPALLVIGQFLDALNSGRYDLDRTALLTADAAEPKSCADYRAAGLPCRAAVKGPGSVAAGMKWLQSLNAIIIDPVRCPETAAEFTGYEYLRDARTGEVTNAWPDADNHHIDAVRYALESVWRRRGS